MKKIAFIDLEASGLGPQSWPIEAAWCAPDGAPTSFLVKPAKDWELAAWDAAAEALHGVSYKTLVETGRAPAEICAALNKALTGRVVYSDAPDWDGFWLYRLFQACDRRQMFSLTDFREVFADIAKTSMDALIEEATRIAPHCHRAGPDVLHMKALYELSRRRD